MKLILQLDDAVADAYAARLRPNQSLAEVLAIQLTRFASFDPRDRLLVVDPVSKARIESLTTHLPLLSAEDLVSRVAALAELSIGRIRFRWTPTQWKHLLSLAERWRMSPREYAERVVRQLEEDFFSRVPGPKNEPILLAEPEPEAEEP